MEEAEGSGREAALGSHRDGWLDGVVLGWHPDRACVWEAMAGGSDSPDTCGALGCRPGCEPGSLKANLFHVHF